MPGQKLNKLLMGKSGWLCALQVQFVTYDEAVRTKNNIIRATYSNLFHFLVAKMNVVMGGGGGTALDGTEGDSAPGGGADARSGVAPPAIDRTVRCDHDSLDCACVRSPHW